MQIRLSSEVPPREDEPLISRGILPGGRGIVPVDPSRLRSDLMAVTQPPQMPVQTHAHMRRGIRLCVSHVQTDTQKHIDTL